MSKTLSVLAKRKPKKFEFGGMKGAKSSSLSVASQGNEQGRSPPNGQDLRFMS
jgi:hypothetical protein